MKVKFLLILSFLLFVKQMEAQNRDEFKNNGFFNITQFSFINNYYAYEEIFFQGEGSSGFDLNTTNSRAYSLQTIFGYFVLPRSLSLGIGIGLDGYSDPTFNSFPVFFDVRYFFSENKNSPYAYIDMGTLVRISNEFKRGVMFSIGAGYKFFLTEKTCMIVDFGFDFKGVSFINEPYTNSDDILNIRGFAINVGFMF